MNQHYLQSDEWCAVRKAHGSVVDTLVASGVELKSFRSHSLLGDLLYLPGLDGVNAEMLNDVAKHYKTVAASKKNLLCKVETGLSDNAELHKLFTKNGWKAAKNTQYGYTVMLDLTKSTDQLMAEMKKRGRYEIKKAYEAGVTVGLVEPNAENLEIMYGLLSMTSERKQFDVRQKEFIYDYWRTFASANKLRLFFAYQQSKVIAGGVMLISNNGKKAWYKDGGSLPGLTDFGPRLLLWEAAKTLKSQGVELFDLGGIPAPDGFQDSHMKGVFIFKTAYSRDVTKMLPAYELMLKPINHKLLQKAEQIYVKANRTFARLRSK